MSRKQFFSPDQIVASDPARNIWVQANAGTGKTTVLIQRLLRILFRDNRDNINAHTSGVLCLTYTNAAAGEMRNRILAQLRKWAAVADNELTELLDGVTENATVSADDLAYARKIFFTYIDNPEILKIKTIHSFCEEILHRFPLEAGISPAWSLVSGASQTVLLQNAFDNMIKTSFASGDKMRKTLDAFYKIIDIKSEYFLNDLYNLLSGHYKSFFVVDNTEQYREYFFNKTQEILRLDKPEKNELEIPEIQKIIDYATNVKKPATYITNIINLSKQYIENTIDFEKYKNAFLTKENGIIKNILKHNALVDVANRVYNIQQYKLNKSVFENTMALFDLSMAFAESYKQIKQERNLLDFEDLVLYTQKLLSKPDVMGWVLSQLDVSISHILVDEAQDTSPQQWNILKMLSGDFFTDGDKQNNRSIFVVGDTKQSIYGFQNADPNAFAASRDAISEQIKQNYRVIQEVALDQSFRSVEPILKTVDYFFGNENIIKNTGFYNNTHKCFRIGEAGLVEIHALSKYDAVGDDKTKQYVRTIADKIESIIKTKKISPNDIMVLLQKRRPFAEPLSNVLKRKGIPVAGSDRINLPSFPAIKDMLNLVRFCINTKDDYGLCCVLKSPIYKLKERDIFNLCKIKNDGKKDSVFDVLSDVYNDIYNDLMETIKQSEKLAPYSFFNYVLNKNDNRKKIISGLGEQVIDPLEEFLTMCLAYERTQSGTLRHFLKWFITGDSEIKRDMDASNGVRIMTVHGSKGLASPVVFLIDTITIPKTETILKTNYLHNNENYDLWIWKTNNSDIIDSIVEKNKNDAVAEYYRLLYVAMTRTRDELYIYGCDTERVPEISWHNQLWNVLSQIKDAKSDEETVRITNDTKFN